jgi:hypothetical protein
MVASGRDTAKASMLASSKAAINCVTGLAGLFINEAPELSIPLVNIGGKV